MLKAFWVTFWERLGQRWDNFRSFFRHNNDLKQCGGSLRILRLIQDPHALQPPIRLIEDHHPLQPVLLEMLFEVIDDEALE